MIPAAPCSSTSTKQSAGRSNRSANAHYANTIDTKTPRVSPARCSTCHPDINQSRVNRTADDFLVAAAAAELINDPKSQGTASCTPSPALHTDSTVHLGPIMPPDVAIDNAHDTPDAGYLCCGVKHRQRINDAARIKQDKVIIVTCQQHPTLALSLLVLKDSSGGVHCSRTTPVSLTSGITLVTG